jgi:cell division protein FtsL
MPVNLNLLPPELTVSKTLNNFLKTTRALGVIALAAFLIFVVGAGGYFVYSSITLRDLNAKVEDLKSQVTAQQTSEQQMVLLKDRLKKISSVQKIPNSSNNLASLDPILASVSSGAYVNELDVDALKIDMLINFRSNSELSGFIKNLSATDAFKSVTLSSFSFSPASGYLVGISMVGK